MTYNIQLEYLYLKINNPVIYFVNIIKYSALSLVIALILKLDLFLI